MQDGEVLVQKAPHRLDLLEVCSSAAVIKAVEEGGERR